MTYQLQSEWSPRECYNDLLQSVCNTLGYMDARSERLIKKAINREDTKAQCFLLNTGP